MIFYLITPELLFTHFLSHSHTAGGGATSDPIHMAAIFLQRNMEPIFTVETTYLILAFDSVTREGRKHILILTHQHTPKTRVFNPRCKQA